MANSFFVNYYNYHKDKEVKDSPAWAIIKAAIDKNDFSELVGRIHFTTDLDKAVSNADLVVEAVFERLSLKHEVFERIEAAAKK